MNIVEIIIEATGNVRMIYDEAIDAAEIGRVRISRGSHVEPTDDGRWSADLSPVNGPTLGPFQSRSEAIAAEVSWLRQHWLNKA